MDYLIFGGGVGSLFGLLKWLKGKPQAKIFDDGSGKYRVYRGDGYYEVIKKMESAISGTLGKNKVSKIAFTKDKGKTFQGTDISEKECFFALRKLKP